MSNRVSNQSNLSYTLHTLLPLHHYSKEECEHWIPFVINKVNGNIEKYESEFFDKEPHDDRNRKIIDYIENHIRLLYGSNEFSETHYVDRSKIIGNSSLCLIWQPISEKIMNEKEKEIFAKHLETFVSELKDHISTEDGQWTVKGFVDAFKNVYSISADTKIISKILEIHLLPKILNFAQSIGYKVVLAEHQNYYPDLSFVKGDNSTLRFAVDFKTTYRNPAKPHLCNGFTLGSHGAYFENRSSTKNIQYPYGSYAGHFCLGIIYDRAYASDIDEARIYDIDELHSIVSVVKNFQFFVAEKWKIASDKGGSGNTANIGSINNIADILAGRGMFSKLGENWFDEYWMNYRKITIQDGNSGTKKISTLKEFVVYKNGDVSLVVDKRNGAQ